MKLLVILLITLGEALAIGAEMFGARFNENPGESFWLVFGRIFILMILGSGFVVAGYMLGYSVLKNIWIISAISLASIIIIEPILAWAFFHQVPTPGAIVSLCFGVVGLLIATWA